MRCAAAMVVVVIGCGRHGFDPNAGIVGGNGDAAQNDSADATPGVLDGAAGDSPVGSVGSVSAIAAGMYYTCLVGAAGNVYCWGFNADGRLGDGTTTDRLAPTQVVGLTGVVELALGDEVSTAHTCARLASGDVACWGLNGEGQLGDATNTSSVVPVMAQVTNVVSVAAGRRHSCALLATGDVNCWGWNNYGQLGTGNLVDRNRPTAVSGLTDAIALAAGGVHTCAVRTGGLAVCWGDNASGQLGDSTTTLSKDPVAVIGLDDATAVAAHPSGSFEYGHTCVATSAQRAKCWGMNTYGQLGDGSTGQSTTPVLAALTGVVEVVAGGSSHYGFTCARQAPGTVWCWGYNGSGQLGDNTTTNNVAAVPVMGLTDAIALAAGDAHACALQSTGMVVCWGANFYGELGNNSTTSSSVPVAVQLP